MKAAKTIPKDNLYQWIASSLPDQNQIKYTVPTSETYTIEIGPHDEEYKKIENKEYKNRWANFHKDISKIASMISRKKLYDKGGKLNCHQVLAQRTIHYTK